MTTTALVHAVPGTVIAAKPLFFYGHLHGTGGDPSNPASSRYSARHTTADDNRDLVLSWIQRQQRGYEWTQCDVGTHGSPTREVDVTVRRCWKSPCEQWIQGPEDLLFALVGTLILASGTAVDLNTVTFADWEVLRYEVGDHFGRHADRIRGPHHLGTVLLAAGSKDLEGGVLVRGDVDCAGPPSLPLAVFIPLGAPHAVTPITCGVRYVAKAAVYGHGAQDEDAANAFLHSNMRSD